MATFPYYILDHGFSAVFSQRPFSCNSPSPLSDRPLSLCGPSYVTLCLCTHGAQLPNRKHTCLRPMIQDPNLLSNPSSTYQSRPAVVEGHNLLTRQLGGEGGGGFKYLATVGSQPMCLSVNNTFYWGIHRCVGYACTLIAVREQVCSFFSHR